jgi:hypothetical protein
LGIAAAGATGKSIGATAASQNPVKNYSKKNPVTESCKDRVGLYTSQESMPLTDTELDSIQAMQTLAKQ